MASKPKHPWHDERKAEPESRVEPSGLRETVEREMREEARSHARSLCRCADTVLCIQHATERAVGLVERERERFTNLERTVTGLHPDCAYQKLMAREQDVLLLRERILELEAAESALAERGHVAGCGCHSAGVDVNDAPRLCHIDPRCQPEGGPR